MDQIHPLQAYRQKQSPPLSPAGLAKLLGISRSYLSRIESGERQISHKLLPLIREKTGIPPRDLRPDLADLVEPITEAAE